MQTVWSGCARAIKANGDVEMKIGNSVKLLYCTIVRVVSSTGFNVTRNKWPTTTVTACV
jgi:hypothetical protein